MKLKIYKCDSCGKTVKIGHKVSAKHSFYELMIRLGKIHLCDECFKALSEIAKKREDKL